MELEQELINLSKRMSKLEKRHLSQEVKSIMSKFEKYNDVFSIIKDYSNNHLTNKPSNKNKAKIVH